MGSPYYNSGDQLSVKIIGYEVTGNHTEYLIQIHVLSLIEDENTPENGLSWTIKRRYNEFYQLNASLSGVTLDFPAKKYTGIMSTHFIQSRKESLQRYLDTVMSMDYLAESSQVKKFLDPKFDFQKVSEIALRETSYEFIDAKEFKLGQEKCDIGCRNLKTHFSVKKFNEEKLLSFSINPVHSNLILTERNLLSFSKSYMTLDHPNLLSYEYASFSPSKAIIIQPFFPKGSLRDLIYFSKPNDNFCKKYGNTKSGRPCAVEDVQHFGFQLLQALKFLKDKGYVHGNVHSGNIFIQGPNLKLGGLEGILFGWKSHLKSKAIELKQPSLSIDNFDVYCSGHVMYEMCCGSLLSTPFVEELPPHLPEALKNVFFSILSKKSTKESPYPTIESVCQHSFFKNSERLENSTGNFKLSNSSKEALCKIKASYDESLRKGYHQIKLNRRKNKFNSNFDQRNRKTVKSQTNIKDNTGPVPEPTKVPPPPPPPISKVTPKPPSIPPKLQQNSISINNASESSKERGALLSSITNFNKIGLKKTTTIDKSKPKI